MQRRGAARVLLAAEGGLWAEEPWASLPKDLLDRWLQIMESEELLAPNAERSVRP